MRIVAGRYKGRNLISPKGEDVRPTTTRIKETLFNILQRDIPSARVLDLFAGSGSLGIESISRGAEHVTFVDKSKESIALIRENLKGIDGYYSVLNTDFMSALAGAAYNGVKYDVIFLDPPYSSNLAEIAIDRILNDDLLSDCGVIVFEHGSEKTYTLTNSKYKQRTKKMGTVTAEFITRKTVALMAGSFDPFTRGHEEILDEALCRYDEVVVACLINPDKKYMFGNAQRLGILKAVCENKKGATALFSDKYAVEVARECGAEVLIRGVRDEKDARYEREMAEYNRDHGYETVFIEPRIYKDMSATKVRTQLKEGNFSGIPSCAVPLMTSKEFAATIKDYDLT